MNDAGGGSHRVGLYFMQYLTCKIGSTIDLVLWLPQYPCISVANITSTKSYVVISRKYVIDSEVTLKPFKKLHNS